MSFSSWLGNAQTKTIHNSILAHLLDSGYAIDKTKLFGAIHSIHGLFPIGFNVDDPNLCVEKNLVKLICSALPDTTY